MCYLNELVNSYFRKHAVKFFPLSEVSVAVRLGTPCINILQFFRCQDWLFACDRLDLLCATSDATYTKLFYLKLGVCEGHFDERYFSSRRKFLNMNAIPTQIEESRGKSNFKIEHDSRQRIYVFVNRISLTFSGAQYNVTNTETVKVNDILVSIYLIIHREKSRIKLIKVEGKIFLKNVHIHLG